MPLKDADTGDNPHNTDAYKYNNWGFVGADSDQGFLFYLFHIRAPRAANFRWAPNRHRALHWRGDAHVGMPKPWLLALDAPRDANGIVNSTLHLNSWFVSRTYTYLGYSSTGLLAGDKPGATFCMRSLWSIRRAIEVDPRFHELPDPGLLYFAPYVPLW